jgi:hypothetical protein
VKFVVPALTVVLVALMVGSVSAAVTRVRPAVFNETDLPNAAVVEASWHKDAGIHEGHGLILGKIVPTSEFAAAVANVTNVAGKTILELGFSVRTDAYCGAGAPRFNLYTEENGPAPYFFGCNSSGATNMETVDTFIDSEGIEWEVKRATLDDAGALGETIDAIELVHDEQGVSVVDDITVNNKVVKAP